jgi:hypothetical protein
MKAVISFDSVTEAEFAAGLLNTQGIACEVRNEVITGALGPSMPFLPEVWVLHDEDLNVAREILRKHRTPREPFWNCPACKTSNEAAFDACWSCGTPRT